jgi:hypothetical protein
MPMEYSPLLQADAKATRGPFHLKLLSERRSLLADWYPTGIDHACKDSRGGLPVCTHTHLFHRLKETSSS